MFALISAFLPAQGCLLCSGTRMLLIVLAINFASLSAYVLAGRGWQMPFKTSFLCAVCSSLAALW
ncbi:MAG: hypothetical protein ACTTIC_04710 [Helicobacteraceae bacterium]